MDASRTHEVSLAHARLRYHDTGGDGPVAVLVHGALVDARLWGEVVPALAAAGIRCVAPDWPLGAHEIAVPDADLTPPGLAAMIGELLTALDLHDVTLIANDTGGGLTQVFLASDAPAVARVAQVVLTPSDSFESFFPPRFAYLPLLARLPGGLESLLATGGWPVMARLPISFGGLSKRGPAPELVRAWMTPARRDPAVRADLRRFLRAVDRRHTLDAARRLATFDRPVLLAWASEDRVFPITLAHRLADTLPRARVVGVPDSYTFVPVDQPARLSEEILEFLRAERALPDRPGAGAAP